MERNCCDAVKDKKKKIKKKETSGKYIKTGHLTVNIAGNLGIFWPRVYCFETIKAHLKSVSLLEQRRQPCLVVSVKGVSDNSTSYLLQDSPISLLRLGCPFPDMQISWKWDECISVRSNYNNEVERGKQCHWKGCCAALDKGNGLPPHWGGDATSMCIWVWKDFCAIVFLFNIPMRIITIIVRCPGQKFSLVFDETMHRGNLT